MTTGLRHVARIAFLPTFLLLAGLLFVSWSILISLKDHLVHGRRIQTAQFTVELPLMWRVDNSPHAANGLHLGRAKFGTHELEHLIIERHSDLLPQTVGAEEWQHRTLSTQNVSTRAHFEAELIPSKHQSFYCVRRYEAEDFAPVDLTCKAGAGEWSAVYYGAPEHLIEARTIIASIDPEIE